MIRSTEPYIKLELDEMLWAISDMQKAITGKLIYPMLHISISFTIYSLIENTQCVKKNYVARAPYRISFSMVVYQKRMLSVMPLNDRELTVFSSESWSLSLSLSFFTPPSFCPLDCPSLLLSPLGWTLCPCAPCLLLLLLLLLSAWAQCEW